MDARIIPIKDKRIKDVTGMKFGRLTVVGYVGQPENGNGSRWLCRCECGGETVTRSTALKSGWTKSCGCYRMDQVVKHMDSNSSEYRTWDAMKRRCFNPETTHFEHYGGRGITVCDRWRESYANFLSDMGRRPSPKHSLDRINNDGNYELSNCRWTLQVIQIRNRSNAVRYDLDGKLYSAAELAEKFNINFGTLRSRLRKGWPVNRAVSEAIGISTGIHTS